MTGSNLNLGSGNMTTTGTIQCGTLDATNINSANITSSGTIYGSGLNLGAGIVSASGITWQFYYKFKY